MTSTSSRLLAAASVLSLLAACPQPTPRPPDAEAGDASVGDGDAYADDGDTHAGDPADAGDGSGDADPVISCDDLAAPQACLSNRDCAAAERCASFSDTEVVRCCVPGERGQGEVGEPCAAHDDCAFGLCLERDDGQTFCSGACGGDLDCPGVWDCSDVFGWCVPTLDAPADCFEAGLSQCFYNDNCGGDERCENVGAPAQEVLCCTTGPRGTALVGEACDSGLDCDFGRCIGGLCSAACGLESDPCPPDTMECNDMRGLCEPAF